MSDADLARLADLGAARLRPVVAAASAAAPTSTSALLTKSDLAQHLRVKEAQIDRFVRRGMPRETVGTVPRFDLAGCRAWLAANARSRAAPPAPASTDPLSSVTPVGRARKVG
jgi:hypothetical protein